MRAPIIVLLLAGAVLVSAYQSRIEKFDTSGMPRRPTNFAEQQIFEMLGDHKPGDLADAVRIQQKLGRYYAEKGDEARSTAAFLLAAEGEKQAAGEPPRDSAITPRPPASDPAPVSRTPVAGFSGNYYGYEGRTLHTWEFQPNGGFLHTWIVSGGGANIRNSERGRFELERDVLVLKVSSAATGFTAQGVGGNSTLVGGGAQDASEIRRVKIAFVKNEDALVLDGVKLKPKSW
jgi:hypothetical protein